MGGLFMRAEARMDEDKNFARQGVQQVYMSRVDLKSRYFGCRLKG